ncbi:fimbrial biogenesis chaperone [Pantoea agglomerans]|uniref:fimbrial biogenesis chaperone n=1 Tax=Enterobacter agglomerans TaxID=549 RepID=UPI0013BCF366|nr:fimbria/pilus periplasmic chaperone [Pantoea agglomerans]NEG59089.1 fimbria/pilus periplasmic chaperone [Pantoea agglomerans]NEG99408.1 fimbria/pilus periplasmic chaperone [Pantoea agglomerans]NEH02387.1 fimbria/pilus periplasmic chaperone [Pantoea agglomerans]NEH14733.1 fimbria/pilus periplasmic chaperone [Pantoea agglomerans]
MRSLSWVCLAATLCSSAVHAGGVGLGATRMIYSADAKQSTLQVRNTHAQASFLIQSWMENANGKRTQDFVITPPLYVLKPATESVVKIIFNGKSLPQDRESLYWITVKAIPQQTKNSAGNSLQFASANRIKVFYRPASLPNNANEASQKITGEYSAGKVVLSNPTPWFITTINLKVDGKAVKPVMLPPKSSTTLEETFSRATSLTFQTINDYGAWTPVTRAPLKRK